VSLGTEVDDVFNTLRDMMGFIVVPHTIETL